ncbi:AAA family ATPase [Aquihabitans sp. G128]|uniref:AAA family ATPase n=1 Tax=Aquihabitans sp. G128 TaxID=2849779 RepID=UPI001C229188|nr:AAA family ATPase [Aquihabitans sp. G128]QXC59976.1 AAA family ATPase [Aquihabitans sp. G128]
MLLTGVSGTGKSSAIVALRQLGIEAIDTDEDGWRVPPAGPPPHGPAALAEVQPDWLWDEPRMAALLAAERAGPLVVAGAVENQGRFLDRFDHVVVLTAPAATIDERLRTRTTNPYGRDPDQRARVLAELQEVEPLMRRHATRVVDTTLPLDQVVALLVADLGA